MEYNFQEIEEKWQKYWATNKTFKAEDKSDKPKYYGLSMFPYPSGAGLHVGHPLGYIASDIYARYKKLSGYNVLHPMGYDSFGLPAEQYAIQTGQHPAITTATNLDRYRTQLDKIGFSFDWDREVKTSDPSYYKWTQWIFKQIYNSWYNNTAKKAESIENLEVIFENEGNADVDAACSQTSIFTAAEWKAFSEKEQQSILMNYRLTYLADSWVNWCPALGTVLANDEIKDGVSERGGHPVVQKLMRQWSMRITAYADRLIEDLTTVDWTESIKDQQKNWIGKSVGASVVFKTEAGEDIEVFTTRPDTIFGVSFMVLAPEHDLVAKITTDKFKNAIEKYQTETSLKTERDRQADVKTISGQFTGAYAIHPFTGKKVEIWIADYVLAGYGTGAVMAVPCGDQRDYDFANHFGIDIINIFKDVDISKEAYTEKDAVITDSDFLTDLPAKKAMKLAIYEIEKRGFGKGQTNFRLRDAVFSRQRYWGEPFPVYYKDDVPYLVADKDLPVTLPEVDKYLPTEDGEPPLARAKKDAWNIHEGDRMEFNTMPGWAGSSWYFLRYMDPHNEEAFVSKEKADYWNQVDLYIGGSEHATGHLLYSRFWTKFLYDRGFISFVEPFKKMINQGMILGRSSLIRKLNPEIEVSANALEIRRYFELHPVLISANKIKYFAANGDELNEKITELIKTKGDSSILSNEGISFSCHPNSIESNLHVDIKYVEDDILNIDDAHKDPMFSYLKEAIILTEDNGEFICGHDVEKMSKSKFNVVPPDVYLDYKGDYLKDSILEKYGADTLRCYEMFLGPLEQAKPWDTNGISGVHNFLRKFWRLFHDAENNFVVSEGEADKKALKTLHKTIKKIQDDLDRFSFNTAVSNFMIATNELTEQKCNSKAVLEELLIMVSPYAPHICEELWSALGHTESITKATFPKFNPDFLVEAEFSYPVSFNGKMRFMLPLPTNMGKDDVEKAVLANEQSAKYLDGKAPKKVIVVPGRIVNIVV
ncbi:leucine--tRNA ligase [Crocinitomix catalasitica]|uniref:leucine--tRNA ligase n=1 Tax=Crocinitomix catalasitica TaxID=184607 RepID=UPI000488663E|nr:class I tRNA ligase family protein [Crocinitomix catalasitica]